MPRIYTSANAPLDFCQECFPRTEELAYEEFGDVGNGPDDRGNCFGYDADHPAYDCDVYICHGCRKQLGEEDEATRSYQ